MITRFSKNIDILTHMNAFSNIIACFLNGVIFHPGFLPCNQVTKSIEALNQLQENVKYNRVTSAPEANLFK